MFLIVLRWNVRNLKGWRQYKKINFLEDTPPPLIHPLYKYLIICTQTGVTIQKNGFNKECFSCPAEYVLQKGG